ncbi:unnamed protein product [Ostreobium quekettii]|uniref:Uncharacterized protein n=1 Tax=Ostreobium quekettii TaxID=121088 RepID=A0A8S1J5M6_9CHLO|nr:unnamed protein product [Ostreobium quekettii]
MKSSCRRGVRVLWKTTWYFIEMCSWVDWGFAELEEETWGQTWEAPVYIRVFCRRRAPTALGAGNAIVPKLTCGGCVVVEGFILWCADLIDSTENTFDHLSCFLRLSLLKLSHLRMTAGVRLPLEDL